VAVELWLVRHGQAAFATGDYDRLTELGHQQARWLGEHLRDLRIDFDRIAAGRLRRQQETARAVAEVLGGEVETVPGLEEYDSDRLLQAHGYRAHEGTTRREHFQRLRAALMDWAAGHIEGAETWVAFDARVRDAVAELTRQDSGRVIAASSGGAIAMVLTQVLGIGPDKMVEFNLQARNTGITRLVFSRRTVYFNMFNAIPHLERPDRAHAETYS
jgi:broad specificity phosphatase PhoE